MKEGVEMGGESGKELRMGSWEGGEDGKCGFINSR